MYRAEAVASFVLVFGKVIQEEQQIIDQITQRFEARKSDWSYQSSINAKSEQRFTPVASSQQPEAK